MSIPVSTPPVQARPVQQQPTAVATAPKFEGNGGGATGLRSTTFESNEVDNSTQVNSSSNVNGQENVQINTAFQRAYNDQFGGGIGLGQPVNIYTKVTRGPGGRTYGEIGLQITPTLRGRKLLKKRHAQIDQTIAFDKERHCLQLAQAGYQTKSCEGVLIAARPVEPKVIYRDRIIEQPAPPLAPPLELPPAPVPALW